MEPLLPGRGWRSLVIGAALADRGIGADATIEQIEAAYGPAPEKRGTKGDTLIYDDVLFSFHEGELHEIEIDPENKPEAREPLPDPKPYNDVGKRSAEAALLGPRWRVAAGDPSGSPHHRAARALRQRRGEVHRVPQPRRVLDDRDQRARLLLRRLRTHAARRRA